MRAKKPYHKRRPSKHQIARLCGAAAPEDGRDPRYDRPDDGPKKLGRKTLQLCSQVQRTLEYVLAAECGDPVLNGLQVRSVEPAPNSTRLLVTLVLPPDADAPAPDQVSIHLLKAAGKLRCEVAAGIHRKKVPDLAFCIVSSR